MGLAAANFAPPALAHADPTSTNSLVAVGADTDQYVLDYLGGYEATSTPAYPSPINAGSAGGYVTISNWDASNSSGSETAPSCIVTKAGGPDFDRPNSTTNGITALLDSITTGAKWYNTASGQSCTGAGVSVLGEIDFARAARGPKTSGTNLTFIPWAQDALGLAYYIPSGSSVTSLSLTTAQLKALYSGTGTTTADGVTVTACLPISTSALWTGVESATGDTAAQLTTATTDSGCNGINQNDGNSFVGNSVVSGLAANDVAVIPFSSASWLAQANGIAPDASATARTDGVGLTAITDGTTVLGTPYSGSAPTLTINNTYYQDTLYALPLYNVVPTSDLSGFVPNAQIEALFVGSGSVFCSSAVQTIAHTFGEASNASCGATTSEGNS